MYVVYVCVIYVYVIYVYSVFRGMELDGMSYTKKPRLENINRKRSSVCDLSMFCFKRQKIECMQCEGTQCESPECTAPVFRDHTSTTNGNRVHDLMGRIPRLPPGWNTWMSSYTHAIVPYKSAKDYL